MIHCVFSHLSCSCVWKRLPERWALHWPQQMCLCLRFHWSAVRERWELILVSFLILYFSTHFLSAQCVKEDHWWCYIITPSWDKKQRQRLSEIFLWSCTQLPGSPLTSRTYCSYLYNDHFGSASFVSPLSMWSRVWKQYIYSKCLAWKASEQGSDWTPSNQIGGVGHVMTLSFINKLPTHAYTSVKENISRKSLIWPCCSYQSRRTLLIHYFFS